MDTYREGGAYLPVDSGGYLGNDCPLDIYPPWCEAIQEIGAGYQHHLQERLHSAYVRGSVARGKAIIGFSDIDTFAIMRGPKLRPDREWQRAIASSILSRYPFVKAVELDLVTVDELEFGGEMISVFFFLKTQSRCIAGTDLAPLIPSFRLGCDIAVQLPKLGDSVNRARNALRLPDQSVNVAKVCHWIMKILVRGGFELVMERENAYTRDLTACVQGFSKYYPLRAESMRQALELAVYPTAVRAEVAAVLADLGAWLARESRTYQKSGNGGGGGPETFQTALAALKR